MFYPLVNKNTFPMLNQCSHNETEYYFCCSCNLWVHCERTKCRKYRENIDDDAIENNLNINYCRPICINTLILYQKSTKEECNNNNLVNCLRYFNLEGVEVD